MRRAPFPPAPPPSELSNIAAYDLSCASSSVCTILCCRYQPRESSGPAAAAFGAHPAFRERLRVAARALGPAPGRHLHASLGEPSLKETKEKKGTSYGQLWLRGRRHLPALVGQRAFWRQRGGRVVHSVAAAGAHKKVQSHSKVRAPGVRAPRKLSTAPQGPDQHYVHTCVGVCARVCAWIA